ncbi:general substrate transporter [Myxozyma melibiosi]|uniref:General substrate transporter n=1 Tax=Myxozyma melibiosi TaxID=54550 RepID=A0ABR1F982_9ASCO
MSSTAVHPYEEKIHDDFVENAVDDDEHTLDPIEDKYGGTYMWLIATSAAVGGLLFGYDLAIISGVLVMLGTSLDHHVLSSNQQELLTSITSGGAFLGALMAGFMLDRFGRRTVIGIGAIIFTLGSLIQALSWSLAQMTVGRLVVGLGIGEAAMVAPIYIAEVAPAKLRGRLVSLDASAITFGQCVANIFNIIFEHVDHGWRYSVALGCIPSILLLILCFIVPETPRHLIRKNKIDEAIRVTAKIYIHATPEEVESKVRKIRHKFEMEERYRELTFRQQLSLLYKDPANFKALIIACGIMGIQQFAGSNTLIYYSPTLFGLVGFKNAIAVSIVITATNFASGLLCLPYLDIFGRRRFINVTYWGCPIVLIVAAVAISYIPISKDLTVADQKMTWAGVVVLVCTILFILFFASALGNIPWQGNELFPMEVRSLGTMMLTLTCWGSNIVVSSTYLSMMKNITPSGTFGFYAGINLIGYLCIFFMYPEVSGMTLEQVKNIFEQKFGWPMVKYSVRLFKERKQAMKLKAAEANDSADSSGVAGSLQSQPEQVPVAEEKGQ